MSGYAPNISGPPPEPPRMTLRWVTNEESWFAHLIEGTYYGQPGAKCSLPPMRPWTAAGVNDKPKCGICLEWEQENG